MVILDPKDKPRNTDDYDKIISAEFPNKETHPLAFETISRFHIHGPCGSINPQATCMINNKCSKHFPKPYSEYTHEEENGYPVYQRRNDGTHVILRNTNIDNSWIVPYNLFLSTKYNAHINVEICTTVKAVKYLYKVSI